MKRTSRLKHKSGDEAVPKRRGPTTLEQFMQCCLDSQLGSLKSPNITPIWGWVKTLYPCSSHQNSWDLWMFIPLKMYPIGIDPYPYQGIASTFR